MLKNIVVSMLAAWGLTMLASAWFSWQTYVFYKRLAAPDFTPEEDIMAIATNLDTVSVALSWTSIGIFVLTVIAFCVWTYQAARNARRLSSLPQKISPGWAVGWYFVPFANFWKPFQAMREIWWRSAWPQKKYAPPIINIWWILWIALNFVDRAVGRMYQFEDLQLLAIAYGTTAAIELAWLAPTVILAWIVDRVTRMQIARHAANPSAPADADSASVETFSGSVSAV
jgi:hypothetical protein